MLRIGSRDRQTPCRDLCCTVSISDKILSGCGFRDVTIQLLLCYVEFSSVRHYQRSCGNRMRLVATNIVANLTRVSTRSLTSLLFACNSDGLRVYTSTDQIITTEKQILSSTDHSYLMHHGIAASLKTTLNFHGTSSKISYSSLLMSAYPN